MNFLPVSVKWADAHADRTNITWTDLSSFEDTGPYINTSVGVMLEGLKAEHVSIAQSFDCESNVDTILHVPEGMVKEIVFLTPDESKVTAVTRRDMEIILYFLERVVPKGSEEEGKLTRIISMLAKKVKDQR